MKLTSFVIRATGRKTIGVYQDGKFLDVAALSDGDVPDNMLAVLETRQELGNAQRRELREGGDHVRQKLRQAFARQLIFDRVNFVTSRCGNGEFVARLPG